LRKESFTLAAISALGGKGKDARRKGNKNRAERKETTEIFILKIKLQIL
jgi:hypothetical protein